MMRKSTLDYIRLQRLKLRGKQVLLLQCKAPGMCYLLPPAPPSPPPTPPFPLQLQCPTLAEV